MLCIKFDQQLKKKDLHIHPKIFEQLVLTAEIEAVQLMAVSADQLGDHILIERVARVEI